MREFSWVPPFFFTLVSFFLVEYGTYLYCASCVVISWMVFLPWKGLFKLIYKRSVAVKMGHAVITHGYKCLVLKDGVRFIQTSMRMAYILIKAITFTVTSRKRCFFSAPGVENDEKTDLFLSLWYAGKRFVNTTVCDKHKLDFKCSLPCATLVSFYVGVYSPYRSARRKHFCTKDI